MSKKTIFDYARLGAQAEQRILDLLDNALHSELADDCSDEALQDSARPRQGQDSSG